MLPGPARPGDVTCGAWGSVGPARHGGPHEGSAWAGGRQGGSPCVGSAVEACSALCWGRAHGVARVGESTGPSTTVLRPRRAAAQTPVHTEGTPPPPQNLSSVRRRRQEVTWIFKGLGPKSGSALLRQTRFSQKLHLRLRCLLFRCRAREGGKRERVPGWQGPGLREPPPQESCRRCGQPGRGSPLTPSPSRSPDLLRAV